MRFLHSYLALCRRRGRLLTALGLVLVLVGWYYSAQLRLKSDFVELLPKSDRNVEVFRNLVDRAGSASSLLIGVESSDFAANKRFVDDLTARLRTFPRERIARVAANIHEEKAFFEKHRYLYARYDDLLHIRDELRQRFVQTARRHGPFALGLDDEEEAGADGSGAAEPARSADAAAADNIDFAAMEAKYRTRAADYDKYIDGYFTEAGGKMLAIVVRPAGSSMQVDRVKALLDDIKAEIAALGPTNYHPEMRFTFTGDVRTSIDEHEALRDDLIAVTVICLLLEILAILAYYRTLRSLLILGLPLAAGVAITFAITYFAIGYLSSSTAFLGSIVVGNGINSGIILFARYMEERRRGKSVATSLEIAVPQTIPATLSASLGAAVAYGAMMLTRFRGFSQFGLIGGVGMVVCWLFVYLLMPPLLTAMESYRPLVQGSVAPRHQALFVGPLSRWVTRYFRRFAVVTAVLSLVAGAIFVVYLRHDPFEYDFNKLRTKRLLTSANESERRDRLKMIFGETQAPNIILADRADQVPLITAVLENDANIKRFIDRYETLDSYLPTQQAEKIALLAEIRTELLRVRKYVKSATREKIDTYLPAAHLTPIGRDDLPPVISDRFTETNGQRGLMVYTYPKKDFQSYDGHVLLEFARATGELHLANGDVIATAGRATIFAAMLSSIIHDGPRATVAALVGVLLLAALSFRRRKPTWLVVVSVLAGVALTGGVMALLGVKLNFLNFIAFPITFGIGADYAFNILKRYMADGPGSAAHAVASSGGAVGLCSITTIIGYGTLLVSDNRALNSFGALAGAAEVACLGITLTLTPALLVWLEQRKHS